MILVHQFERPFAPYTRQMGMRAIFITLAFTASGLAALIAVNVQETDDTAPIALLLKDPNPQVRRSAVLKLEERGAVQHADAIAVLLDDPDSHLQTTAVWALGRLKAHRHVAKIARFLEVEGHEAEYGRHMAYHALRNLDGEPVVDTITRLLDHEDPKRRLMAVRLMGHWKVQRRESVLAVSLKDESAEVREAAVEALANLPAKVSLEALAARLEDVELDVRSRAAVALGRLNARKYADRIAESGRQGTIKPEAAAEGLLRMDPSGPADEILFLLDALARVQPQDVMDCTPDFDRVPCLGFRELVPLACARGMDDCMVSLIDRSRVYPVGRRSILLQAVSWHGSMALAKALDKRGLLTDRDSQDAALIAIARELTPKDVPALMDLVRRLDPQTKQFLSFASGRPFPFTDEFVKFADDADPTVRRVVVKVLSRDQTLRNLPRLLKFADDPDPGVRSEFANNAAYVPGTDLDDPIGKLVKDRDPAVSMAAIQAVSLLKLTRFAADVAALMKDEKRRVSAMFCLVRLGAKEHSASIVPMLSDAESGPYAAQLLAQLGAPERVPDLLRVADTGDIKVRVEAIKAAAFLGGPIPKLDDWLADKEDLIRAAAANAAGTLRDRAKLGTLEAMIKDPSFRVRAEAIRALANLGAREHLPAFLAIAAQGRAPGGGPWWETYNGENGPAPAVQAAVDAVGLLGNRESARELAGHLKHGQVYGFGGKLHAAILRLDPKPNMPVILARVDMVEFLDLNRWCATKLYETIGSRTERIRWHHGLGTLEGLAARLSSALRVKFTVDPSVPVEVRTRSHLVQGLADDRNAAVRSFMHSWPECAMVYDEERNEVRIVTVEEAKRFWLNWAK